MKKVFFSIAIVAMCLCAASCGNNANKAAEGECACTECCDSCTCAATETTVVEVVEAAAEEVVEAVAE